MFKNNGKKTIISVASTAGLCLLLVLLVAVQHHWAQMGGQASAGSPSPLQDAAPDEDAPSAQGKRSISAYLSKLTRGRREAEKPARFSAPDGDPPPAEDLSANDIFIAVKTTKKFHQSRLNLLLDTWISRNAQQVKEHNTPPPVILKFDLFVSNLAKVFAKRQIKFPPSIKRLI